MRFETPETKEMEMLLQEIPDATSAPPAPPPHHHYLHHRLASPIHPSNECYALYNHYHQNANGGMRTDTSSPSSRSSGTISPDPPEPSRRRAASIAAAAAADHPAPIRVVHDLDLLARLRAMQLQDNYQTVSPDAGFGLNPNQNPNPLLCYQTLRRYGKPNLNVIIPPPSPQQTPNGFEPYRVAAGYRNPDPSLHKIRFGSRPARNYNGFNLEESSLILQQQQVNHGMVFPRQNPNPIVSAAVRYETMMRIEGYIYHIAKDQNGCRFLQRKFADGSRKDIDIIFNGISDHVVELMVNPFGNYLIQKLLDVCTEDQRLRIVYVLTRIPMELVGVCLNPHGTRVVQKLIETLKTRQQTDQVVAALKPGFLHLIKDLNGNHVVQRCLQSLTYEDNKFIFDAAAKHCVDIATHQHGCCVLQCCIAHSSGEQRAKLVSEISNNGLHLCQDAFGNYVVQYILDLKNPVATANLVSQFQGNYVHLSMQKFSSNVVEKCLKVFTDVNQATIVLELLSVPQFDHLLQDPFANYVIQSAIETTKGHLHAALIEAIRQHAPILRTNPYSKRIYTRAVLKK